MYNILRVRRDRKYADLLRFCPYPAVFTYDVFVSSPCISVFFHSWDIRISNESHWDHSRQGICSSMRMQKKNQCLSLFISFIFYYFYISFSLCCCDSFFNRRFSYKWCSEWKCNCKITPLLSSSFWTGPVLWTNTWWSWWTVTRWPKPLQLHSCSAALAKSTWRNMVNKQVAEIWNLKKRFLTPSLK